MFPLAEMDSKGGMPSNSTKKVDRRQLCPFSYHQNDGRDTCSIRSGIFVLGDHPTWILGSERSGVQYHRCQYDSVSAFTATTLYRQWEDMQPSVDFIMHTEAGPILTSWLDDYNVEERKPMRKLNQGKTYSHVRFDPDLNLLVGVAAHRAMFKLYTEEGTAVWESEGVSYHHAPPISNCSHCRTRRARSDTNLFGIRDYFSRRWLHN
jgi:hypothetical protein